MMELTDATLSLQNSQGLDLGTVSSYGPNRQRFALGDPFKFPQALSGSSHGGADYGQSAVGELRAPLLSGAIAEALASVDGGGVTGDTLLGRSLTTLTPDPTAPNFVASTTAASTVAGFTIAASPLARPSELVFIDASLPDYDALLAAIRPHVAVFRLDAQQDGISQISDILAGYQNISALHILSHGNVGALQLGSTWLNGETLQNYTSQLTGWADHLTDTADILLYGCDVALGMEGDWFVHQFGNLTGADIAASTDLTGNVALGGNWTLEVNTGAIAADLIGQPTALAAYQGILLTPLSAAQYTNLKTGVNDFLALTQTAVDTLVFAQRLPLVGSQLASTTKVFQGIQTSLASAWTTLEAIPAVDLDSEDVRTAIATALAPVLPSGVTVDESATQLQFNLNLSQAVSSSLGFDLGLDAIGLSLTSGGAVTTQLGYSLPWKFGVDLTSNQFYVDTSALDELKIDLAVTTPGLNATGKLGFLQVAVTGQDSQSQATSFTGQFRVDLGDPGSDGRLTAAELTGLTATQLVTPKLQAIADVNLGITTSFGGNANFPSLKTDLNLDWTFDPTNLSLLPTAAFNNVRMNLGGFFNEFVSPIFAEVQKVLGPVQPVFDVLRTRMPVLSDIGLLRNVYDVDGNGTVTLLEFIGVGSGNTQAVQFIQAIDQVATFANSIPTGVGDVYIPLGNLRLNNSPTTDLRSLANLSGLNLANTSLFDDLTALLPGVDTATRNLVNGFRSNASNANFAGGLAFPLLQDPTTAFGLLLGRDVSVFTLDLPSLGASFNVSQFFPILGPLGVRLSGAFDIQADFNFGYDTAGFRQFATGGFTTPGLVFNGFYISDTANPDGTGPDVPEVRLNASVQAAGELNVIIAAAGVGGGLFANVNLDLRDRPVADGKIRLDELADNFTANGPLGIFDASGKFTAGLNAYARVGVDIPFVGFVGWEDSFDIASVTLLDFDTSTGTLSPNPVLAQLDPSLGAGVLRLNMGTFAAQRVTGNLTDGDETFKVTRSTDGTQILVSAFGIVQAFAASTIQKIYAEGGNGNDVIDVAADVLLPVELWGDFKDPLQTGFGNDKLFAGGGVALLHGGAGNDELTVRAGNSQAFGEAGNDKLFGGTGNDTLDGGADNDTLYGNAGNDSLLGGTGSDYLEAGIGDDVVRGGDGSDRIKGGDGNDTLFGDADTDIIEAGLGNDFAYGGDGNDFILDEGTIFVGPGDSSAPLPPGGAVLQNVTVVANGVVVQVQLGAGGGNDVFEGGAGNDALFGQAGSDTLFGNEGNDYADGGSGNDILYGNEGDDQLNGGSDNDILLGDNGSVDGSGTVTLGTGNGNDIVFGGIGNDSLYGQAGNDLLAGDGGDDLLFGNAGNDVLFGDSGQQVNLPGGVVRYESTNPSALGNDTLDGGEDRDIEIGGAGNDLLLSTEGVDVAQIGDNGRVTLSSSGLLLRAETSDPSFGGNDTLVGGVNIGNILIGGSGNDSIQGGIGSDIILGDNGVVVGADGTSDANAIFSTDPVNGGNDTILGGAGNDSILGGTGNDTIQGSNGTDLIIGDSGRINRDAGGIMQSMLTLFPTQGGNDTIAGDADADTILGGSGNDSISGGSDNAVDVLLGDNGIVYGAGVGADANDVVSTDPTNGGQDTIVGGGGDDLIVGGSGGSDAAGVGGDRLFGEAGNDIILGDSGRITRNAAGIVERIATLFPANGGDDRIEDTQGILIALGGSGNDTITAGDGADILLGDNGVVVDSDGTAAANDIFSTDGAFGGTDSIVGGAGNDTILGGSGGTDQSGPGLNDGDTLLGGIGDDIILGDSGYITRNAANVVERIATLFPANGGDDLITDTEGTLIALGGSGNDTITAGDGADILLGDNGVIVGNDGTVAANDIFSTDGAFGGTDSIVGGAGNDTILGGSGGTDQSGPGLNDGDTLAGGAGDDIILGDSGYITRNAANVVERIATLFPANGGDDLITDTEGTLIALGGSGNDTITAGDGADILLGDNGVVVGADGTAAANDIFSTDGAFGGTDSIVGGAGNDTILGGSGGTDQSGPGLNDGDTLAGGTGDDVILGDSGYITRNATSVVERIATLFPANGGDDLITDTEGTLIALGGSGNDTITAGNGADILLGDNGVVVGADGTSQANDIFSTDPNFGGTDSIVGGAGNDTILGGSGGTDQSGPGLNDGDTLVGGAGDDIILGDSGYITRNAANVVERIATLFPANGGDDLITDTEGTLIALGGSGNDTITAGDGADILLGDNGVVVGNDGTAAANDIFSTDPSFGGTDSIVGGAGNDTILGGSGGTDQSGPGLNDGDTLLGGIGDDIILGDSGYITRNAANFVETIATSFPTLGGDDSLFGNEGRDTLLGGFGNDTIAGNIGDDIIMGDSGRLDYALDESLTTLDRIVTTDTGIGGNDSITGDDGNDIALGGAANDTLSGNAGDDILLGDNGQISFSGGIITRIETIAPADGGNDVIAGNEGRDRILGGTANDAITGDNGDDIILGDHGILDYGIDLDLTTLDAITSTDSALGGRDTIQGNDGNDIALGGADNDSITGGLGTDTLLGDNGQILYTIGNLRLIQTISPAIGGNDSIQGNQDNDLILGGFGDDSLEGNQGDDKILGDNGFMDYAYGGDATVAADSDFSTLDFITTTNPTDGGRDRILGGAGNDQILGGTGDDTIFGDDGVDGLGPDWQVISTGDFNGDGKSDIFWRNSADNRTLMWLMNGTSVLDGGYTYTLDPSWLLEGTIDFNGDGKDDFLWRNIVNGDVSIWLMNGKNYLATAYVGFRNVPLNWDIRGVGDFNGDGKGDILWRNNATGEIHTWLMNGISLIESGLVGPSAISADWNQIAMGDFNGDGKDDLLWRQSGDRVDIWLMNGHTMQSSTLMGGGIADWQVMGLTDLNGDLRQDLVWRQTGSGRVAVWLMNGPTPLATPLIGPAAIDNSWQIVELGDFNGDSKGDILWRQTGGGMTVWLMNGSTVIADQGIAPAILPASWQPIGFGDFDGDRRHDILWQNGNDLAMWLMNGTTKTADAVYGVVPDLVPGTGRFDDLILGDHGKVYEALPRDRNYLSIDTGAADGGGNDLIYGNQGDDFILGQQGGDLIFGGAGEDDIIGGHNVIGGSDGNDFIDGGANADVEIGDNGIITRRPLGNSDWQRYPAPFPDIIRDVVRFDDVDTIGGNDTVNGGTGDDILYGQRGNDVMDGGAGDDEIYGNLGNDLMEGGAGQDVLLGDVGAILRAYNPDGTPRINTNGSWHRDALLTDVATITDVWNSNAVPSSVYATADLLLLNSLYNPDGSPVQNNGQSQTQVQALTFIPDGNDTISGGSGDDTLFGQRGDDTISDTAGNNYIEGNEGNDTIAGGSGDDLIIGDNSENLAPFDQQIPTVTRGLHIIGQATGLNFALGQFGTIVIPTATLTPTMSPGLWAPLTLAPTPVQSPNTIPAIANLTRNGITYQSLAAIIPDISNHLDQLAGNDAISDSSGNNTLIGDNYRSFSPLRTNNPQTDQALSQLTTQIYHLLYDLHDLEIAQSVSKSAQTLAVGNDTISGGIGRDLVFADDETLYSAITAVQPNTLPRILQTVTDLRQGLSQFNGGITSQLDLYTGAIASPYTLSLKNDIVSGGNGNDQIMAGDTMVFSPVLDGFSYQPGSIANYAFDRTPKAVRSNFQDFTLILNNDIVFGDNTNGSGAGDDLIVGGYSTLIMPVLTQAATTATQAATLRQSLGGIVRDITSVVRDLHNEQYGIAYANRNQSNLLIAENDTLSGGAGNDVIFGDTATFTAPFLNGQTNLGLALPESSVDYTEEPYNFAQALPHLYDIIYRNLNSTLQTLGQDSIQGGAGNDILFGQRWSDILQGQEGNDYLFGGREAENTLDGGSGTNVIRATSPSPSDQQAIAPSINARLAELPSPALQRYLLEILANRNSLSPKGSLMVSFP